MKRLIFDVPKWHLWQHRDHRGLPLASAADAAGLQLEDELFERLYVREVDRCTAEGEPSLRAWAERVHATLDALPAFERLARECRGDAAAAAAAVETLMTELARHLPERGGPVPAGKDPLRRPAAAACAVASTAVAELAEAREGLAHVLFAPVPGPARAENAPGDGARGRPLVARLRDDARLRRIALLAGRMKRIAASKRRSRVRHGADEIADVEQGADLGRLLPAELAKLHHPRRRLELLRALLERQVLQYRLGGAERLGRGPLVALLDKSGSMDDGNGAKDVWASALSLALLEHAQAERRPFALVTFNYGVTYEVVVRPGNRLPHEALFVQCGGGTNIAGAVERGLELVAGESVLRKADLVLVTDGVSEADDAARLREVARARQVAIYGLAIGMDARVLAPWCDEAHGIEDLSTVEDGAAVTLFSS